ncbi:superoxide dismutase-like protein YojM [Kordia sp. SMS9]|nr:superoxide dismutase family protein [Kordia sp. SMS9]AXG70514.1 superoxide dismutase-like protein YojM [Kordia sp. SMS9]
MRKGIFMMLAGVLFMTVSCSSGDKEIKFDLEAKSGSKVTGNVTFTENEEGKVKMLAVMNGLTPGVHAIHIHEKADCSSADGKSAGGHWNPTAQPHGKWGSPKGYHKGDIGNFEADDDGYAEMEFSTDEWCIGCDDKTKNIVGKAIIVHAGADDYTSQPSGAAGARVSCGGIIQ